MSKHDLFYFSILVPFVTYTYICEIFRNYFSWKLASVWSTVFYQSMPTCLMLRIPTALERLSELCFSRSMRTLSCKALETWRESGELQSFLQGPNFNYARVAIFPAFFGPILFFPFIFSTHSFSSFKKKERWPSGNPVVSPKLIKPVLKSRSLSDPFLIFFASKSVDLQTLYISETSIDGLEAPKLWNGRSGETMLLADEVTEKRRVWRKGTARELL